MTPYLLPLFDRFKAIFTPDNRLVLFSRPPFKTYKFAELSDLHIFTHSGINTLKKLQQETNILGFFIKELHSYRSVTGVIRDLVVFDRYVLEMTCVDYLLH